MGLMNILGINNTRCIGDKNFSYSPTPDTKVTKVIMFPLDTFYKVFSNVISLAAIQITAEFFKKISVFKET
jgi:hypothetical protein